MNDYDFTQEIDLHDFIYSLEEPNKTVIIYMKEGYKIREIANLTNLPAMQIKVILKQFETKLMEEQSLINYDEQQI